MSPTSLKSPTSPLLFPCEMQLTMILSQYMNGGSEQKRDTYELATNAIDAGKIIGDILDTLANDGYEYEVALSQRHLKRLTKSLGTLRKHGEKYHFMHASYLQSIRNTP
jgi:hypothetical protein